MHHHVSRPSPVSYQTTAAHPLASPPRLSMVHEDRPRYPARDGYEDEGSERRALGSVSVAEDARWSGTLTVPTPRRGVMFVHFEREGILPAGYRGGEERAFFSAPVDEADALLTLLSGLVAQARRDAVLD